MIGIFGNITIGSSDNSLRVNTGNGWQTLEIEAGRFESLRHLAARLSDGLENLDCHLELVARGNALSVRIWREGALSLDFSASGLGAVLGYATALLQGSNSYRSVYSPARSIVCEAPLYDSGMQRRETSVSVRSNAGDVYVQRLSARGERIIKLAALDREQVNIIGDIMRDAAQDAGSGFYCCNGDLFNIGVSTLHGLRKLCPAQGKAISFTRSYSDAALDLWDCEICALAMEVS